jgi:hypothetical protein
VNSICGRRCCLDCCDCCGAAEMTLRGGSGAPTPRSKLSDRSTPSVVCRAGGASTLLQHTLPSSRGMRRTIRNVVSDNNVSTHPNFALCSDTLLYTVLVDVFKLQLCFEGGDNASGGTRTGGHAILDEPNSRTCLGRPAMSRLAFRP